MSCFLRTLSQHIFSCSTQNLYSPSLSPYTSKPGGVFSLGDNIVDDEDLIHANLAETDDLTAQDESAEENALDGEEDATAASIVAPEEALRAEALRSAKRCKRDIRWIDYNCVISRRSRRHPNWLRF